jgi:murein DD-endopeptidase MepM/ murein hydrolase activator NlpD
LAAALAACLAAACPAGPAAGAQVTVEPAVIAQGQPAVVRVCPGAGASRARARLLGREAELGPAPDGCLAGAVAVDLQAKTGRHDLVVIAGDRRLGRAQVRVEPGDYGVRRITVDPKFMRLSQKTLARHRREIKAQKRVYASRTPTRFWRGGFRRPVPGKVTGTFGRKSLVNDQPRSPHGGVDLRAGQGETVRAAGAGRVALVQDSYFGGLVVLIDHGQGLVTGYRHLAEALVKKGEQVAKGQAIARAGQSGRVTGPHLHFDVHLAGARVDPLAWIEASRKLAGYWGGS